MEGERGLHTGAERDTDRHTNIQGQRELERETHPYM